MKKIISGFLVLAGGAAMAAPTLDCVVQPNEAGVVAVHFANPQSSIGKFKDMVVTFEGGKTEVHTTFPRTTVDSSTVEEWKESMFKTPTRQGFSWLSFLFYVLPEEKNPRGFSPKNGAKMQLFLSGSDIEVTMSCIKKI